MKHLINAMQNKNNVGYKYTMTFLQQCELTQSHQQIYTNHLSKITVLHNLKSSIFSSTILLKLEPKTKEQLNRMSTGFPNWLSAHGRTWSLVGLCDTGKSSGCVQLVKIALTFTNVLYSKSGRFLLDISFCAMKGSMIAITSLYLCLYYEILIYVAQFD